MINLITTVKKNLQNARFTYVLITYSIAIFSGILITEKDTVVSDKTLTFFGAPTAIEIFEGRYWGIITNSFVHFQLGHLVLNIFATLFIASYVERRIGFFKLFIFGLVASLVSSAFQLSLSNDAGIGLSGVNYALFGFIFGKTFIDQRFKIITRNIALIVMVLFIPFFEFMNQHAKLNIATIALSSGLFFGIFFAGLFSKLRLVSIILLSLMLSFSVISLFYAPWSSEWNCSKGIKLHEKLKLKEAKSYYLKAIQINSNARCAKDNLLLIRIDELSNEALKNHLNKNYIKAGKFYDKILELDPKNEWALTNKKKLP